MLSLDGGGMRGTYTATYLAKVAETFARRRGGTEIDIGAAFDLIVGTSTGGIIAAALATGAPLDRVVDLYRDYGPKIFALPLPAEPTSGGKVARVTKLGTSIFKDIKRRPAALKHGEAELRRALEGVVGGVTIADVYAQRGIALAITAVEMSQHRSWVFKTPHLASKTSHRDDNYSLVDVCLATTAAPIYRSMAALDHPEDVKNRGYNVFVDGGLWANNPVLVGLIDALELTQSGDRIEIFCLGTCPMPAGEQIAKAGTHRGLDLWKFGGEAANLSVDAQGFAFDNMARMLAKHVDRDVKIVRFPAEKVPAALVPYLNLDDTRTEAIDALVNQARSDADMTNSRCGRADDPDGQLICGLFNSAPLKGDRPTLVPSVTASDA